MGDVNISIFLLKVKNVYRFLSFSMKLIHDYATGNSGLTPSCVPDSSEETAMRKRRLCVKIIPCADAVTAVYDIQIVAKSKYHLVNYTSIG